MTRSESRIVDAAIRRGERVGGLRVLGLLRARLGALGALAVLAEVAGQALRGEPFRRRLGPTRDLRDRRSRRQCTSLVLLDRALRRRIGADASFALAREAVRAGALPFLEAMIPRVSADELGELAQALVERFFNADGEAAVDPSGEAFTYTVRRCRFVELLAAADASHLAPLFCEADNLFFDGGRRGVRLERSETLASGGRRCDFRFTLADAATDEAPEA